MSVEAEADECAALEAAMPAIREAVISTLTEPHPDWLVRMRAGFFDGGPLVMAGIACWVLAMRGRG